MRFRLAPIIATPLALLLFLVAACDSWVYAQERTFRQEDNQRREGRGCRLIGIEISFNPEVGVSRFFGTDNFHWVEVWVDYRAQTENRRLNPTLYVTQRHDFVQTRCDRDALELYDYSRNVTVLFELDRMRWTYWRGLPADYPTMADFRDIQHILLDRRDFDRPDLDRRDTR
jgi:hypothetical protein